LARIISTPNRQWRAKMKSSVVKRSIFVARHKTSVSLEDAFWRTFKEIAEERHMTLSELAAAVDSERHGNLSSAIRLFVLEFYRNHLPDHQDEQAGRDAGLLSLP
jgi:predicted DNA-binding ribbon-helix-helix protein